MCGLDWMVGGLLLRCVVFLSKKNDGSVVLWRVGTIGR